MPVASNVFIAGLPGLYDLVEGAATSAVDSGAGSLARFPNGADTNDASIDWILSTTPTPGAANTA